MRKKYKVKAIVSGMEIEDVIWAIDPYDAVNVFEIYHDCWKGVEVIIKNVEVIE